MRGWIRQRRANLDALPTWRVALVVVISLLVVNSIYVGVCQQIGC